MTGCFPVGFELKNEDPLLRLSSDLTLSGPVSAGDGAGEVADGGYDGEDERREMAAVQMATGFTISLGQRCWFRREEDGDDGVIVAVVGQTERRRCFFFRFWREREGRERGG
ncbi:hypothetical protein P3L10_011439 [Capsicum annuum]